MGLACSITVALLRICSFLVNCRILSVIFIYIIVILQVQDITRFRKPRALGLWRSERSEDAIEGPEAFKIS